MMTTPSLTTLSTFFVCNLVLVAVSGGLCHSKGGHSSDNPDRTVPPASLPVANRFRSALGVDLTVLVLQYGMCGWEARETLAADPGLDHLFYDHRGGYLPMLGVEVTGAGTRRANGWYRRRETAEARPWYPWFEKHD